MDALSVIVSINIWTIAFGVCLGLLLYRFVLFGGRKLKEINDRDPFLARSGVQTLLSSLFCIIIGLIIGYIVLLIINPQNAGDGFATVIKSFMTKNSSKMRIKELGNTLIKTAPLIMCSLSVLFAYKVGLFNIGAAGQYVIGAGVALWMALQFQMPWFVCVLVALIAGALLGGISGLLKAFLNVNEVISCIMLNWISLYSVNMLLSGYIAKGGKDTEPIQAISKLPSGGMAELLGNKNATIAIPAAVVICILIWILLNKTKLGYELKATGLNKNAAKYAGMREKFNIILTMAIAGALAGLGAAMFFLSGFAEWDVNQTSVPSMGFNGIAAGFLGGLNPIGCIFSSFFIQHITDGGATLTKLGFPTQVADLITAMIIYLCAFVLFFKTSIGKGLGWYEKRKQMKAAMDQNESIAKKEVE